MPTASTLPLLLLIAILWRVTRGRVLSIVLFTSMFGAASALNLGGIGVSPWLFTLCLCLVVKLALHGHRPFALAPGCNKIAVGLFLLFLGWALLSAACFPYLFQGVHVDHGSVTGPLTWRISNLAQVLYLLAVSVVYLLTIGATREERTDAVEWYVRACVAASLIAFYQLANATIHVPYPDWAFYTSPSYVIYSAYKINGLWRLNSTFCEASEMAEFLLPGAALLAWQLITSRVTPKRAAAFFLIVAALVFTLSSLAYLGLIALFVAGIIISVVRLLRHRSLSHGRVMAGIVMLAGVCLFATLSQRGVQTIANALSSTLLDKSKTDSYRERTATHDSALQTLQDTAYMGAGWGSIRASGLGYVLLGAVGIPGFLLFFGFYLAGYRPLFYRASPGVPPDRFVPYLLAVSLMLLAMVTAGSEPVTPVLWALLGAVATERQSPAKAYAFARLSHATSAPLLDMYRSKAHPSIQAQQP